DGRPARRWRRLPHHRPISAAVQEARRHRSFLDAGRVQSARDHRLRQRLPDGLSVAAHALLASRGRGFRAPQGRAFGAIQSLMARTTIEAERILPFAPGDLCRLVGDVREYPKFIPWLQSLRITKEEPLPEGGWQGVAAAIVGWKAVTERFSTTVRSEPAKGE